MTATLAVRERALELTEERYAAAVRKSQELEKEIMQLKAGLNDARWARAQLEIPPRPVFSFSPVSPPAYSSFSTNPVTVWPNDRRSSPQHGTYGTYGTVYVDVDFMVDDTGRVTPLNVRPRL
ncbi:hypothetical protein CcaverHIS631_0703440 [Cutaneotrichosporon cavernicola]|nr:hypothetical protein CcaverHIS631_0703440 [Cutaneotrichosporon cavernicola]BEJ10306.1 hypothetical protein CcaverHIS641_0703410 [Cutaneotrichosporon cavernicola]